MCLNKEHDINISMESWVSQTSYTSKLTSNQSNNNYGEGRAEGHNFRYRTFRELKKLRRPGKRCDRKNGQVQDKQDRDIKIGLLNVNLGINNKKNELERLLLLQNLDILLMNETGLREYEMGPKISGYKCLMNGRKEGGKKGGGVGILIRDSIEIFDLEEIVGKTEHPETIWIGITLLRRKYAIGVIYLAQSGIKDSRDINEQLLGTITNYIEEIKTANIVPILGGDFNCHLGTQEYCKIRGTYKDWNANGKIVAEFILENNFKIVNQEKHCKGEITWARGIQTGVLDLILTTKDLKVPAVGIDDRGDSCFPSDHNLVWMTIKDRSKIKSKNENIAGKGWRLRKMDEGKWGKFKEKLNEIMKTRSISFYNNMSIEDEMSEIVTSMAKVGEEIVGKKGKIRKDKIGKRINLEIGNRKRDWMRSIKNKEGKEVIQDKYKKWMQKRKEMMRSTINNNKLERIELMKMLEQKPGEGNQMFWKNWNTHKENIVRKEKTVKLRVGSGITSDRNKVKNEISRFYKALYDKHDNTGEGLDGIITQYKSAVLGNSEDYKSKTDNFRQRIEEKSITKEETCNAIKRLKNGKAQGVDNVPNEFLKYGGEELYERLTKIFNEILDTGYIPKQWKISRTRLLYKSGKKIELDNYRGITILSNIGKVYCKILANRIEQYIENNNVLGKTQYGFRRNRRASDALFILTQIVEQRRKKGKGLLLAFLDIRKAYDRVWRKGLWRIMEQVGIQGKILLSIKSLYQNTTTIVQMENIITDSIDLEEGLRQGCTLSPVLFSIYISSIGRALERSNMGVIVGEYRIPALFFADDMVIIAENSYQLKSMLKIVAEESGKLKITFNARKSKVLVNWREPNKENKWEMKSDTYEEKDKLIYIEEAQSYKYLGVILQLRGRFFKGNEEIQKQNAAKHGRIMRAYAKSTLNKAYSAKIAWERIIIPKITYGTEVIASSKGWINHIYREQISMGRFITGGSNTSSILALWGEIGWERVVATIAKKKMCYVNRFNNTEDEWGRAVMEQAKKLNTKWWQQVTELNKRFKLDLNKHYIDDSMWNRVVKERIDLTEHEEWRDGIQLKSSLNLIVGKRKPIYEKYLNGTKGATAMFKLRNGDWGRWKKNRQGTGIKDIRKCRLCRKKEENISHLIGECEETEKIIGRKKGEVYETKRSRKWMKQKGQENGWV